MWMWEDIDGTFTGRIIDGDGITCRLLRITV